MKRGNWYKIPVVTLNLICLTGTYSPISLKLFNKFLMKCLQPFQKITVSKEFVSITVKTLLLTSTGFLKLTYNLKSFTFPHPHLPSMLNLFTRWSCSTKRLNTLYESTYFIDTGLLVLETGESGQAWNKQDTDLNHNFIFFSIKELLG